MKDYDYIFAGAGLAALMTVYRMAQSGKFAGKSILLIDAQEKRSNDRTWSFWETHGGEFDKIATRKWDAALFVGADFKKMLDLSPYRYKTIYGNDFYDLVWQRIGDAENVSFLNENVVDFFESDNRVMVKTDTAVFSCSKLFNSIYDPRIVAEQIKFPVLQQHFIGWFVKTHELVFNPNQITLMDFSVAQKGNTRFMYLLPFSETEALVEYTLFSKDLLAEAEYEVEIENYLKTLGISRFEITKKERGSIPMTAFRFWKKNTANILHIGSAGGWTKASTGFTFKKTMKRSAELVAFLQKSGDLRQFHQTSRFWFYDLLFLDVLASDNERGNEIFSSMFRDGKPATILKFLDEETSLGEDIGVILKCPKKLFLRALSKRLFK